MDDITAEAAAGPVSVTTPIVPSTQHSELDELKQLIESKRATAEKQLAATQVEKSTDRFRDKLVEIRREERETWSKITPEELQRRQHEERERERIIEQHRREKLFADFIEQRGERYRDCMLRNYEVSSEAQHAEVAKVRDYGVNLADNLEHGRGLVLFGGAGTGKAHLLVALAREATTKHGIGVHWTSGPKLWAALRDRISSDETSEQKMLQRLIKPPILAISDPVVCQGSLTDYQANAFYQIIDARYNSRRPTWLTVNTAGRKDLDEALGAPIVDRLIDGALTIGCNWSSYRKSN